MALHMEHIDKTFGDKHVLHDFSLDLADGEWLCLLGPSGGGKSTLLHIIAGLQLPDSGTFTCDFGCIGYVFQEYRLLPWLTVQENLTAVTGCTSMQAKEWLAAMELDGECSNYPGHLSGGMQQRVNIARALVCSPDLLLLDEPFKGLDEALRGRIIDRIRQSHEGRSMLLVTHDRAECGLMGCHRVIEFR